MELCTAAMVKKKKKKASISSNLQHQTPCLSAEGDPPKYDSQVDVFQRDRILF